MEVVLIGYKEWVRAMERFFRDQENISVRGGLCLPEETFLPDGRDKRTFFLQIIEFLEEIPLQKLRSLTVITPFLIESSIDSLSDWNPVRPEAKHAFLASLILAYPEVTWIVWGSANRIVHWWHVLRINQENQLLPKLMRELRERCEGGYTPLFDPLGIRERIREAMRGQGEGGTDPDAISELPVREKEAVAIDEETSYAYFHGYVAYRFGYRCHVVTSMRMMESPDCLGHDFWPVLSFEDLYLNFPDRHEPLSQLKERDARFGWLRRVRERIFVTVGHKRGELRKRWRENKAYLERLRRERGLRYKFLYKPSSGIFDLKKRGRIRSPERFEWPPKNRRMTEATRHSAPGRLLFIAQQLINRAETLYEEAMTVEDAIHGALLALEAKELLALRTPTTALEALALQHRLEAKAECMFYGVEYNFDVKERLRDIEREIEAIGKWFGERTRKRSVLSAKVSMAGDLAQVFGEFGQFDEESECLNAERKWHRRLTLERSLYASFKPFNIVTFFARSYIDPLMGSIGLFLLAIAGWVVGFTFLYALMLEVTIKPFLQALSKGFKLSVFTFFGLQPPGSDVIGLSPDLLQTLAPFMMVQVILGFVHLGIFISYLYTIITRRRG